jgi:YD repeat-containing protein
MAEPSQRRPLALVAGSGDVTESSNRRGERIAQQWNPEAQLVGALMYLSAAHAAPIVKWVPDNAIWRPDNRWVVEIIRHLVAHNVDPDPVTVLHTARSRGPAETGTAPVSPRRHHRFAMHLADLYTQIIAPHLAQQYAREVLEDAFRRAVGAHGARLTELAEIGAPRDELAHGVAAMRTELAELWRRTEAARPAARNP